METAAALGLAAKSGVAALAAGLLWPLGKAKTCAVVGAHVHTGSFAPLGREAAHAFLPTVAASALGPVSIAPDVDPAQLGIYANLPKAINLMLAVDVFAAAVLLLWHASPCDKPLKLWLLVGVLFGFPASGLVDRVAHYGGFRTGFVCELVLTALSFAWCATGTYWLTQSVTCMDTAPMIWWTCYTLNVCMWSVLGTMIFFVIVSTVITTVLGDSK